MNTTTTTPQPTPTCRCGGETKFIGNQHFPMLVSQRFPFGYQRPLFDCNQCGTTLAGEKEYDTTAEAQPEAVEEGQS